MPSYKTKQVDENGKSIYQDICYPVTKEFREKLYGDIEKLMRKRRVKENEEKSQRKAKRKFINPRAKMDL